MNPNQSFDQGPKIKKYRGDMDAFLENLDKTCIQIFGTVNDDIKTFVKGLILF